MDEKVQYFMYKYFMYEFFAARTKMLLSCKFRNKIYFFVISVL
jgi:hypothetical protein